jgi:hypothetical protein
MSAELHVGDVGVKLRSTIMDGSEVADLSTQTLLQYLLRKPSGTVSTLTASLVNDGLDGLIEFITVSGTLNEAGFYKLQAYIEITSNKWHTDTVTFRVYPNLN